MLPTDQYGVYQSHIGGLTQVIRSTSYTTSSVLVPGRDTFVFCTCVTVHGVLTTDRTYNFVGIIYGWGTPPAVRWWWNAVSVQQARYWCFRQKVLGHLRMSICEVRSFEQSSASEWRLRSAAREIKIGETWVATVLLLKTVDCTYCTRVAKQGRMRGFRVYTYSKIELKYEGDLRKNKDMVVCAV